MEQSPAATGFMLATAPIYLLVLRSEHKPRAKSGFVGCRSAGKQWDKFSGAQRWLRFPHCVQA